MAKENEAKERKIKELRKHRDQLYYKLKKEKILN